MLSLLEAIPQWFLCNEMINSHLESRWTFSMPLLYGKTRIFFFPLKLLSDPQFWDSKSGAQAMQLPKVTYHYDSEQFLKFYPHSLSQKSSLSIIIYITLFFKYPHCSVPWNIQQWSQHRPQEQTQEGRRSSENRILFRVGSRLSLHLLSLCIKYLLDKQIGIVLTTGDEYQHCTYIISGREINSFYV